MPKTIVERPPDAADALSYPACPLCHTCEHAITTAAVAQGAVWRCARCGQAWSAPRLLAVAAYARWESKRRPAALPF